MTKTNDSQIDRKYMGKFKLLGEPLTYSPKWRFIISASGGDLTIADLFHTRTKSLCCDFSTATIGGALLKKYNKRIVVKSIFAFDLNTMLILFTLHDSKYLALGEVDHNRSSVFIRQTVKMAFPFRPNHSNWFPLSHPPNLYDGVILKVHDFKDEGEYFTIKMGTNEDIQVSQLNFPMVMKDVGCFDGVLYGLVYNETARRIDVRRQIDLVKFSISNGTYVQEPAVNWEIVGDPILLYPMGSNKFCCVGRQVFVADWWSKEKKYKIISLDLDTKKWQRTSFEFPRSHICMHSDGGQTLFVSTPDATTRKIHRIVYNQPDKLSDLVWLRLKRIFDARPSSYNFILSQLPANFKQKCPFSYP